MRGANSIYISPNGASSSLVMLPTQPPLPEAQPREEEEDQIYSNMPITPLTTSFRLNSSTQMARSTSQKRINLELSLGASGQASSPRGLRTPTNFPSGDDYRFPCGTPTRQIPTRRNSARVSHRNSGTTTSQSSSNATSLASSSNRDYFGSDVCSSEMIKVPFPSNISMSTTASTTFMDSPSAKRGARHISLTGAAAASVDSINLIPASPPKNVGPIPIPTRPAFRHLRYSSDVHISRSQMMAASRSDVSIAEDNKSRLRLDSEVGSLYTNTLGSFTNEDLPTSSSAGLRMIRDSSQSSATTTPAKHKLIVVEEGKANVTYQMGNCIGRGQFGSVYRALNLNTGQMVAVKRIKLEGLVEDEVTQLMGEVDLLKSLSHPSVVKYEGLVRGSDVVSIILEFVENGSLLHTLKAFGNFPEKLVASYVVKILEGLNYLHEMKVVHCDLKAANILTTKNGNVKLSDFGVSLNLKAVKNIKNDAIGTPNWMAPEVIELKGVSTAADIWSLGCTIIELLTGKPPYGDMLAMSALWRIVEDDCPPFPDKISEPLRDFLSLCFNKDPILRPSAEMLFEHIWLRGTWKSHMDLRPQDSVPFLRRISADARALHLTGSTRDRHTSISSTQSKMERSTSSPSASLSLRPLLMSMRAASAPDAWSMQPMQPISAIEEGSMSLSSEQASPLTPAALSLTSSPPSMSLVDLALRRGSDPGASSDMLRSPSSLVAAAAAAEKDSNSNMSLEPSFLDLNGLESFPNEEMNKTHAFVKITFGKAVVCKICRDAVKKHAVLCEECGLICHASCTKKASTPCNLRAQLLIYAAAQGAASRGSMDFIRGMSPAPGQGSGAISPHLSSGQDTPPLSPRLFKMPFARTKKLSNAAAGLSIPTNNTHVDTPIAKSPVTPTTALSPLSSDGGTPSSQQRRRKFSLRPYMSRRQSPSPSPIADVSMARSHSSSRSNPIERSREDSLGYGSSISSGTSSMPGALSMTKTDTSTSDPPLAASPAPTKSHVPPRYRHSVQIPTAAASTSHLLNSEKEKEAAERKAKRRQSASVQRVTTPTEIAFPSMHPTRAIYHQHHHNHQQSKSVSMPPGSTSSAKRSRRLSSKQDCIVM